MFQLCEFLSFETEKAHKTYIKMHVDICHVELEFFFIDVIIWSCSIFSVTTYNPVVAVRLSLVSSSYAPSSERFAGSE